MNDSCLYQLSNITQSYGGPPVLRIDRLEVQAGEILCLVGPTGSGKSTLLRLLSTLETPASGDLRFGDCRSNGQGVPLEVQRRVSLVFQRPLLLQGSVRANVEYGLKKRGQRQHLAYTQQVLDGLGIGALAGRSARTLSGGETQLVALARALVLEPDVILLDEPTANLDPARVGLVERMIATVHRERRSTVIWATHNIFQARRVAQRVAFLLDGRLVEIAPTAKFFDSPADPRTAAFVRGEMVY